MNPQGINFKLGDKVIYKGRIEVILGFDKPKDSRPIMISAHDYDDGLPELDFAAGIFPSFPILKGTGITPYQFEKKTIEEMAAFFNCLVVDKMLVLEYEFARWIPGEYVELAEPLDVIKFDLRKEIQLELE